MAGDGFASVAGVCCLEGVGGRGVLGFGFWVGKGGGRGKKKGGVVVVLGCGEIWREEGGGTHHRVVM